MPLDKALQHLSHRHRRLILIELQKTEMLSERDLLLRNDDPETANVSLKHAHLPKLADAGYIAWDPETGTIERGPAFDEIAPLLDSIRERDPLSQ